MKNLVQIAMVMMLIGLSLEAVCQEEAAVYPAPQPEPVPQPGTGVITPAMMPGMGAGELGGYGPGAPTAMPGMMLPSFDLEKKTALIIPAGPLETEVIGQLTEDIHVMAQILYETIHPDKVQVSTNRYLRWSREMIGGFFGDSDRSGVTGLYLQGYGIVFLQQVDFPLVPFGEQPPAADSSAQPTDEVWQRTQRKLQGEYEQEEETESQRYDADRVEQLKESVLQSLRHAANIRHLDGREWVIVMVQSSPHRKGVHVHYNPQSQVVKGRVMMEVGSPQTTQEQPSFLMVRAQKKDVDDLAAGRIGPEEFAAKATVITY